jgi:CRP/FNR family transcriptional regulator, anaerobic regulatory protein
MNGTSVSHCESCPTRHLCLAEGLEGEQLQALATCVRPCAPMHKGDYLFRAGDPADACFVVRSGAFKTFVVNEFGDEYITGFYYPGEILGTSGFAAGVHDESATALDTATTCRVRIEVLPDLWSIGTGPALLRLLGRHDRQATEDRINLTRTRADARIARFLLNLSGRMKHQGRDPAVLPTPMSRTDIANHLGMTLESLSRVIARLSRARLITAARTEITLNDAERLHALACQLDD